MRKLRCAAAGSLVFLIAQSARAQPEAPSPPSKPESSVPARPADASAPASPPTTAPKEDREAAGSPPISPAPEPPASEPAAPESAGPEPAAPEPSTSPTTAPAPVADDPDLQTDFGLEPGLAVGGVQIHGFASQGGFLSTSNEYIGQSSRGSLELFETAINFSTDVADRLRVGAQFFARDFGVFDDASPRLDWAFVDYQWRPWLGLRAGIVKMPFGLYNEYTDIDAARLPILMPQGVYPFRNRDVLLSHRGFTAYGTRSVGPLGELQYQAWLGTLSIPENALVLDGASLESIDTKYVTGAQAFWAPPIEGLRVGGTLLRASIDFNLTLDPDISQQLIMAGLVPAEFDGELVVSQRPTTLVVGSAEYVRGPWLLAGEYSRSFKHQQTSLPDVVPAFDEDSESFYGMAAYRLSEQLEVGSYYSVHHLDTHDRRGRDPKYAENFHAFQRDLAATLRYDVNEHWLWKLEAHFIDGTADLPADSNPDPDRYWGLFLFRTTVTF